MFGVPSWDQAPTTWTIMTARKLVKIPQPTPSEYVRVAGFGGGGDLYLPTSQFQDQAMQNMGGEQASNFSWFLQILQLKPMVSSAGYYQTLTKHFLMLSFAGERFSVLACIFHDINL